MKVPEDWPKPIEGGLMTYCQVNFCGGAWVVYDHTGKIKTQYLDPWRAVRHINKHNQSGLAIKANAHGC